MTTPKPPLGLTPESTDPEYEKTMAMDLSAATSAAPMQTLAATLPDLQRVADEPPTQDERALTLDDSLGDDLDDLDDEDIDAPTQAIEERPVLLFDPARVAALTEDSSPPSKVAARAAMPSAVKAANLNTVGSLDQLPLQPNLSAKPNAAKPSAPSSAAKPAAPPTTKLAPQPAPPVHHHPTWRKMPSVITVSLLMSLVAIITVIVMLLI